MINKNDSGARYYNKRIKVQSSKLDQYHYSAFLGAHQINLEIGDCCYYLDQKKEVAQLARGPQIIKSPNFAVVVRGYAPPQKTSEIFKTANLPYINGCSTRQIFAPERPGDPTLQLLFMPEHTQEQLHHIHPTARVVYVLEGQGYSLVGLGKNIKKTTLTAGMMCVLDPMCPHHFETTKDHLIVLPVHVWSSIPAADFNHPMYSGTLPVGV